MQAVCWWVYRYRLLAAEPKELLVVDHAFHVLPWALNKLLASDVAQPEHRIEQRHVVEIVRSYGSEFDAAELDVDCLALAHDALDVAEITEQIVNFADCQLALVGETEYLAAVRGIHKRIREGGGVFTVHTGRTVSDSRLVVLLVENVLDDVRFDALVEEILAVDEAQGANEVALVCGFGALEVSEMHGAVKLDLEETLLTGGVGIGAAGVILALAVLIAQIYFLEVAEVDMHLAETLEHLLTVEVLLDSHGFGCVHELHEAFGDFATLEDQHLLHLAVLPKRVIDHVVAQLKHDRVVDAHQQHVRRLLFTHLNKYIISRRRHSSIHCVEIAASP